MKKKKNRKTELKWNLVNSALAGFLVFLGGFLNGGISGEVIFAGVISGLIIACSKFNDWWKTEQSEYTKMFGNMI